MKAMKAGHGEAPSLETKSVALPGPLQAAKFDNVAVRGKHFQRGGYVVRLAAPMSFQEGSWTQWDAMVKDPGAHARASVTLSFLDVALFSGTPGVFRCRDATLLAC